jgi:hypothetical protein
LRNNNGWAIRLSLWHTRERALTQVLSIGSQSSGEQLSALSVANSTTETRISSGSCRMEVSFECAGDKAQAVGFVVSWPAVGGSQGSSRSVMMSDLAPLEPM